MVRTVENAAQELLGNPVVLGALQRVLGAREKATRVQTATMEALNLPSASDVQALGRRVRSLSQRIEGLEDGVDRVEGMLSRVTAGAAVGSPPPDLDGRLGRLEEALSELSREIASVRQAVTKP